MTSSPDDCRVAEARFGENRVNLIRTIAILVFYGNHLAHLVWDKNSLVTAEYNRQVTTIMMMWLVLAVGMFLLFSRGSRPPQWLSYLAISWDVVMATQLLIVSRAPSSVLLMMYLLIVFSAVLRQSWRVVYFSMVASVLGYLSLLWFSTWGRAGYQAYYENPEWRIPRWEQGFVILSILVAGGIAAQATRQYARALARDGEQGAEQ